MYVAYNSFEKWEIKKESHGGKKSLARDNRIHKLYKVCNKNKKKVANLNIIVNCVKFNDGQII